MSLHVRCMCAHFPYPYPPPKKTSLAPFVRSWLPRALATTVFMALVSTLWMPPCYWPLPNYRTVGTEQAHGSSSLMDRVIEQSTNDMRRLGSALGI